MQNPTRPHRVLTKVPTVESVSTAQAKVGLSFPQIHVPSQDPTHPLACTFIARPEVSLELSRQHMHFRSFVWGLIENHRSLSVPSEKTYPRCPPHLTVGATLPPTHAALALAENGSHAGRERLFRTEERVPWSMGVSKINSAWKGRVGCSQTRGSVFRSGRY